MQRFQALGNEAMAMDTPFNERGVSVTRNAISAAGQVFTLRDVHDVRVITVGKNRVVPTVISLCGVAVAIAGGWFGTAAALVCGAMLVVVGGLAWTTQDVTHRLIVATAAGDREAVSSTDADFVARVEHAVKDALAAAKTQQQQQQQQ